MIDAEFGTYNLGPDTRHSPIGPVMRTALTLAAVGIIVTGPMVAMPAVTDARIIPCAHRGIGHWLANGGPADDIYHRAHHERLSCH